MCRHRNAGISADIALSNFPSIHRAQSALYNRTYLKRTLMNTTAAESGDLLTTEQVMDRLLADNMLRRLAATCVLPAVRYGSEWRFRKSDLDAWIQRQRVLATMAES